MIRLAPLFAFLLQCASSEPSGYMDFIHISSAAELLTSEHPHFGRVQSLGFFKSRFGILRGTSRKALAIDDYSSGKRQTVALSIDPENFMVTIASSFVLVTMKEGSSRPPVILKTWKMVKQRKGGELTDVNGTVKTYSDADGLKWEHRFNRTTEEDELIGFGDNKKKILVITLERFA